MSTSIYRISLSSLLVALVTLQQAYAINSLDCSVLKEMCIQDNVCYIDATNSDEQEIEQICIQIQEVQKSKKNQYDVVRQIAPQSFQHQSSFSIPDFTSNYFQSFYEIVISQDEISSIPIVDDLDKRILGEQLHLQLRI